MANTVRISYTADTRGLQKGTRDAEGQLNKLNETGKRALGGLDKAALALGVSFGVAGVVGGIRSSIDAAKEAERASAALGAQIDALGLNYAASKDHIDEVITAQSKLAALDDEELMQSFTAIVRVTKDVNQALDLNALAADIARGRNMDLVAAGELVAKVAGGNTSILRRYGIQIDSTASSTEALGELQRLFAGQAEAYGESNAGAADRAAVAWENAKEALGERLLPLMTRLSDILVQRVIPFVSDVASKIDAVAQAVGGWENAIRFILVGTLALKISGLATTITRTLIPAISSVGTASVAAATVATGPKGFGAIAAFLGKAGPIYAAILVLQDLMVNGDKSLSDDDIWDFFPLNQFKKKEPVTTVEAKGIIAPHVEPIAEASGEVYAEGFGSMAAEFMTDVWDDLKESQAESAEELGQKLGVFAGEGFAGSMLGIINNAVNAAWGSMSGFQPSPTLTGVTSPAASAVGGLPTAGYTGPGAAQSTKVAGAINWAVSQQGTPYVYGGGHGSTEATTGSGLAVDRGGKGFDCSGLISAAYKRVGVTVPGTAEAWSSWPYKVASVADLLPGDVIQCNGGGHVVLYIGNGRVIAASGGPSGGGADQVVVQGIPSGITGMFRPLPGAVVPAATVGDVVTSVTPTATVVTGTPTSTTVTVEQPPPVQTDFPKISGISTPFERRFEAASRPKGTLFYNPETGKYESDEEEPSKEALLKIQNDIGGALILVRRKIRKTRKTLHKKRKKPLTARQREFLSNRLAVLLEEEAELLDLWNDIADMIRDIDEAAANKQPPTEPTTTTPDPPPPDPPPAVETTTTPTFDPVPDLEAQLAQSRAREASSALAARLSSAFVESIGIGPGTAGGVTVVFNTAFPPTQQMAAQAAAGVAQGLALQGHRPSSVAALGV